MNKSVLISSHPEQCLNIANGNQTLILEKTAPTLPTPFKGLIYCTKGDPLTKSHTDGSVYLPSSKYWNSILEQKGNTTLNGKVIGEFICDGISSVCVDTSNDMHWEIVCNDKPYTIPCTNAACLSVIEFYKYLGDKGGYALHISNIKIYGRPRELSEFVMKEPLSFDEAKDGPLCCMCNSLALCSDNHDCNEAYSKYLKQHRATYILKRPPQSWRYVYDLEESK